MKKKSGWRRDEDGEGIRMKKEEGIRMEKESGWRRNQDGEGIRMEKE